MKDISEEFLADQRRKFLNPTDEERRENVAKMRRQHKKAEIGLQKLAKAFKNGEIKKP